MRISVISIPSTCPELQLHVGWSIEHDSQPVVAASRSSSLTVASYQPAVPNLDLTVSIYAANPHPRTFAPHARQAATCRPVTAENLSPYQQTFLVACWLGPGRRKLAAPVSAPQRKHPSSRSCLRPLRFSLQPPSPPAPVGCPTAPAVPAKPRPRLEER